MKKINLTNLMACMLALMGLVVALVSCDKIKELLETPEYPDENFTIVGT